MLILLVSLAAAWLLWSGLFKPLLLGLGVFSCAITFILVRRMGYFENELFAMPFSFRLFGYWLWLGKEIVRSSIDVARIILDPKLPISPRIVEFEATAQKPVGQVTLGNSITLTPGTLTMEVTDDGVFYIHWLYVHSLDEEAAAQQVLRRFEWYIQRIFE